MTFARRQGMGRHPGRPRPRPVSKMILDYLEPKQEVNQDQETATSHSTTKQDPPTKEAGGTHRKV